MNKQFEISNYLREKILEEFGEPIFAFACYKCDCGEGLAVFKTNTIEPILLVKTPTNKTLAEIYSEAIQKAGFIPASNQLSKVENKE